MKKMTLKDINIKGKRVLMRADYNVPLDDSGVVTDDIRVSRSIPTIKYILEQGGKLILMSHLGRPKGKVVGGMRLDPVQNVLSALLGQPVKKMADCIGRAVTDAVEALEEGDVLLLENLRFYKEETDNDVNFSKSLAAYGDIYVNDAFGTAHRAHASTEGVCHFIDVCVSGFLMERELAYFDKTLSTPTSPFVAVLGGAKVSDKILVIETLMDKVDALIIGGGMAYTFLKAQGVAIGTSLLEADRLNVAKTIIAKAREKGVALYLPEDHIVADAFSADANTRVTPDITIPEGWMALDIGPKTIVSWTQVLEKAQTVIWNGPVGVFEMDVFAAGTEVLARTLAASHAISVIGGGDTAAAVKKFNVEDAMSHVSTGGGASLELMEGKVLPGVFALSDKSN